MAGKVMILSVNDICNCLTPAESAMEAYKFALENAGLEMDEGAEADFIVKRNAKSGWRDLWELKGWCEKTAESIKEVCKHTFNVGSVEQMPIGIGWKSGGTTKSFAEGAGAMVIQSLINRKLVTKEQIFDLLDPSKVAKAAGMKVEKLMDMFPDTVVETAKAPSLSVK